MLTDKERSIVYACIHHWDRDVKTKFLLGIKAFPGNPPRWQDGSFIACTTYSCPMCKEFLHKDLKCDNCLFVKFLSKKCDKLGGLDFIANPSLETCNNFMLNFQKILEN